MKLWKYIAALILAVSVWIPVHAEEAVADSVATEADFNVKDVISVIPETRTSGTSRISEKIDSHSSACHHQEQDVRLARFSSAEVEEGHQYEGFYISEESGKSSRGMLQEKKYDHWICRSRRMYCQYS